MAQSSKSDRDAGSATEQPFQAAAPQLSLPKGGGAIRGIGEKFAVNPANGTASFTIPIFTTPSRSDFYPQLSLSYESGAGNGPFGMGWKLSVPSVTRKTDKGLPQYQDAENSDIFILSDAEDLVPALVRTGGSFQPDVLPAKGADGRAYLVKRYRPRVEGLFALVEKWQDALTGETHWQSVSKDNVTSVFGQSRSSRIADPDEPAKIFRWLLEKSYDDKGNLIVYDYKQENADRVAGSPEETTGGPAIGWCCLDPVQDGYRVATIHLRDDEAKVFRWKQPWMTAAPPRHHWFSFVWGERLVATKMK